MIKSISTSFQKSLLPKMTKFTKKIGINVIRMDQYNQKWTTETIPIRSEYSNFPNSSLDFSCHLFIFQISIDFTIKNDQIRAKINKSWSNLSSIGQNLVATNQISPKMTSNRSNMIKFNENDQRNEWKWTKFNGKTKIW